MTTIEFLTNVVLILVIVAALTSCALFEIRERHRTHHPDCRVCNPNQRKRSYR